MRLYAFTNYYLSPLQKGLQTAHVVADLATIQSEYLTRHGERLADIFREWSVNHKTIIILNGGNNRDLIEMYESLSEAFCKLGILATLFSEDEQSLNGAATAWGMIVPEKYYLLAEAVRKGKIVLSSHTLNNALFSVSPSSEYYTLTDEETKLIALFPFANIWEKQIIDALNSCGLAN